MSAILLMMFFLHFVSTRHFSLHIKIIIIQEVYSTHCIYELFLNKLIVNRFRQNLWINYTVSLSVKWPSKKKKKQKRKSYICPCHVTKKENTINCSNLPHNISDHASSKSIHHLVTWRTEHSWAVHFSHLSVVTVYKQTSITRQTTSFQMWCVPLYERFYTNGIWQTTLLTSRTLCSDSTVSFIAAVGCWKGKQHLNAGFTITCKLLIWENGTMAW